MCQPDPNLLRFFILTSVLVFATGNAMAQGVSVAEAEPGNDSPDEVAAEQIADRVRRNIAERINDYRREQGLDALSQDDDLREASADFAKYMSRTDRYGHNADGNTPAQRAESAGYDYCVVRENIAYRTNTGEVNVDELTDVLVQGWIDSPPHKKNIVADYVTETGVGVATEDGVTYFAVQMFGRPRSEAFQIQVTNRSDQVRRLSVESDGNRDQYEIGPRMRFQMTRCLPTNLKLAESEQDNRFQVRRSSEFAITEAGLKPVTKDEKHDSPR